MSVSRSHIFGALCVLLSISLAQSALSPECRTCKKVGGKLPWCARCLNAASNAPRDRRVALVNDVKHKRAIGDIMFRHYYEDSVLDSRAVAVLMRRAAILTCQCCAASEDPDCCTMCSMAHSTFLRPMHADVSPAVSRDDDVCVACCYADTFDAGCCLKCEQRKRR